MDKMMSVSQSLKRLDGEHSALFRRKPVLKRNLILAIVVISPFILGIIDYATGHELPSIFYRLPSPHGKRIPSLRIWLPP